MPTLVLIDISADFGEERHEITVPDRDSARTVLKGDLRATADREWGDAVLAEFDSGKDEVVAQNGPGHSFAVLYKS